MKKSKNYPNKKITLEDLLQLKKHERPNQDFWQEFDHKLQQRRLQLMLRRRGFSWGWLTPFVRGIMHPALPLSAMALFVVTLFIPNQQPTSVPPAASLALSRHDDSPWQPTTNGWHRDDGASFVDASLSIPQDMPADPACVMHVAAVRQPSSVSNMIAFGEVAGGSSLQYAIY